MIFYSWAIIIAFPTGSPPWNLSTNSTLKITLLTVRFTPLLKTLIFLSRAKSVWSIQHVMNILPFLTNFKITPLINTLSHWQNSIWRILALELMMIQFVISLWKRDSVWGEFNAPKYMKKMLNIVSNPRKRLLYW